MIVALQSDQAQIAGGLGPVQMVQAEDEAGAELILQSERFGESTTSRSGSPTIPTRTAGTSRSPTGDRVPLLQRRPRRHAPSDGPIGEEHLADVAGQTVAFVDQGSASGYLVPSLQLLNAGVDPIEDITPLFAGGHDAAVQAVYDGDAAVGVSFNDARGQLVEQIPDVGEQVVVFAWSFPIPNDGFAVGGDLPDDLKEAITAALHRHRRDARRAGDAAGAVRDRRPAARSTRRTTTASASCARSWPTSSSERLTSTR